MSMLSLAEAQSAREQKGKHRPPDARAAQQQRWAETVEHWASEADAAWKLLSEARGRLRSADVALRGEQGRFAQSHTRGYTTFTRGEHGVRIPSPETVAGEVGNWTAVFNKGVRRVTGVAPWGARSSSLPGYLRLSASSRRLLLVFISVWLGLAARLTALSSASLPLLRSGRGLGRCRLLPLPGIGLAAPSLCGVCAAAPPWAAAPGCASSSAGAAWRLRRAVALSIVSVTVLPFDRHWPAYSRATHMAAWCADCSVCLVAALFGVISRVCL